MLFLENKEQKFIFTFLFSKSCGKSQKWNMQ